MDDRSRRFVGLSLLFSGIAMGAIGLYLLLTAEPGGQTGLIGGVLAGVGGLDLILGLWFVKG